MRPLGSLSRPMLPMLATEEHLESTHRRAAGRTPVRTSKLAMLTLSVSAEERKKRRARRREDERERERERE